MSRALDVPVLVRRRALANGAAGAAWLDALPEVVAVLAAQWELAIGAAMHGGTAGFVAEATDAAGRECVLKVAMPIDEHELDMFRRSVLVHRLANGRGCARLLELDDSAPALLLERLGPNLDELALSVPSMMDVIARTLLSFWQPATPEMQLPTGAGQAAWLTRHITQSWAELGRPCDRAIIDRAVSYCDERATAFDPSNAVLVHGDAHGWNTLAAGDGTFKFVDPEGLLSERAHDLAVPMREYNQPLVTGDTRLLVHERAELLAGLCGIEPEPVWQWGFVERVSTGLANIRDFGSAHGGEFLEVARRCL